MNARMAELGMEPVGSEPDQFAALIRAEVAKYQKIAKQANIKID
jgi:tripartite-type tricarboxylate transporter receptor subunit TctC